MEVNEEESSLVFLKGGRGTVLLYAGHQFTKTKLMQMVSKFGNVLQATVINALVQLHCRITIYESEQQSFNAMLAVFPEITTKGCYYHFRNSIWRKCKSLQLVKNKRTRRIVALCAVLPLLPRDKIESGWSYIQEFIDVNDNKMCLLVSYMNTFWMKDSNFIDSWCVFGETHRTDNFKECWHVKINNECRRKKATLLKILKVFKDDAALYCLYSVLRKQVENCVAHLKAEQERAS